MQLKVAETGRETKARVFRAEPAASGLEWDVSLELLEPSNIWGIEFLPRSLDWPADLPGLPIETKITPPTEEKEKPPSADPQRLEDRSAEILKQATNQLTRNAQFAMNTLEESVREITDSAREEFKQWVEGQRIQLAKELKSAAPSAKDPALQEALERIRRENREDLEREIANYQTRLEAALRAVIQTLIDRLIPRQ